MQAEEENSDASVTETRMVPVAEESLAEQKQEETYELKSDGDVEKSKADDVDCSVDLGQMVY